MYKVLNYVKIKNGQRSYISSLKSKTVFVHSMGRLSVLLLSLVWAKDVAL